VCDLDFADRVGDANQRELIFVAELWQAGRRLGLQVSSFVPTKHLALIDPAVIPTLRIEGRQLAIELTSKSFARLLECSLEGVDVVFSDNYFDLPAGRVITISCPLPVGWTLAQASAAFKIRTVYDTYTQPAAA
jgi:beta-mannosidase